MIFKTTAPNLYAAQDVADQVQVRCLRDRLDPALCLLFMLVYEYEHVSQHKFRLEFLPAKWSTFLEFRRAIIKEEVTFDPASICNFFDRGDLIERLVPLLPKVNTEADEEQRTSATPDNSAKHLFSRSVAKALNGNAEAAVLYRHLRYWCDFYRKEEREHNHRSGRYWRYDSLDALHKHFPYLTRSTIYRSLGKLREAGYIEIGCFNKWSGDKTQWYHARRKDRQGNAIEADGKVAFEIEKARRLGSVTQACILALIQRKIERNRREGRVPETLLGSSEFMFLLPFSSRTIRRAIADLLKKPEVGLRQSLPTFDDAEEQGGKPLRDRRWKPKLYSFVDDQPPEPLPEEG